MQFDTILNLVILLLMIIFVVLEYIALHKVFNASKLKHKVENLEKRISILEIDLSNIKNMVTRKGADIDV